MARRGMMPESSEDEDDDNGSDGEEKKEGEPKGGAGEVKLKGEL
jgi:hypothetical protein